VGVRRKVFDEDVCYNYWSDALIDHYEYAEDVILHDCEVEGGAASYYELRQLYKRWKSRTSKWLAKNTPPKTTTMIPSPAPATDAAEKNSGS
jgi:hypothetical protein